SATLECLEYCTSRNRTGVIPVEMRFGIHSGKVVGAVVGIRKYIYDVFGSTINIASRMQSHAQPMEINMTETTYQLIKDAFICRPRSPARVKGIGEMQMYSLLGKRHPLNPASPAQDTEEPVISV